MLTVEKKNGGSIVKRKLLKIAALCLIAALLLTACSLPSLEELFSVSFEEMEYERPDVSLLEQYAREVCDSAPNATDVKELMQTIQVFYDEYVWFYTNLSLANIYYCKDLTDLYWEEEYLYCMEKSATVDAAFEEVCYTLADCPLREALEGDDFFGEGYFDDYDGENYWDDTFTAMMEQEAALVARYYDLTEQSADVEYYSDTFFETYGTQMGQLYVELVALRQEIAEYAGFEDYPSFAYDLYYERDYSPAQAGGYLREIQQKLVPLYRQADYAPIREISGAYASEADTLAYVKSCAEAMGGTVGSAFRLMDTAGLYDISYGENKFDSSFEVFLPCYGEPYILINPTQTTNDKLTFAHEFGHFCNDYASGGSVVGIDVAEIFSQGMEYLSLCYAEEGQELTRMKMYSCLSTFVEQAMYASFEHQVYSLEGEELTAENVYALYEQTGMAYGFDSWWWDSRDFVLIPHLFTNPMYVVSYVVSNDAALQLYQLEREEPGRGLSVYDGSLSTMESGFLAFVESAGLESPFAEGRLDEVQRTLEEALK